MSRSNPEQTFAHEISKRLFARATNIPLFSPSRRGRCHARDVRGRSHQLLLFRRRHRAGTGLALPASALLLMAALLVLPLTRTGAAPEARRRQAGAGADEVAAALATSADGSNHKIERERFRLGERLQELWLEWWRREYGGRGGGGCHKYNNMWLGCFLALHLCVRVCVHLFEIWA